LAKKKVLFHHDNAPAHTSALPKAKFVELGYELLPHPPCSPDLATCDFFLFPNLKKSLAGQKFASNEEVVAATKGYFADLEKTYFFYQDLSKIIWFGRKSNASVKVNT